MSLLLDALKRAEEAKRARLSAESSPLPAGSQAAPDRAPPSGEKPARPRDSSPELRIEDYKEVIPPGKSVRESAVTEIEEETPSSPAYELEIEPAEPAGHPTTRLPLERNVVAPPSRLDAASADAFRSRDTTNTAFLAKKLPGAAEDTRNKWLLPAIAGIVVLVGGGAWYVWNEINRMARPAASSVAARPASTALAPALPATGQPGMNLSDENKAKAAVVPAEPLLPPLLPPPAQDIPAPELTKRVVAGATLSERELLAKSLKEAPASKEVPVTLRLARSIEPAEINTDLADAYAALKKADYARAKTLYAKLLQADAMSIDSQLGMATVLARQGESTAALTHYRQVLALDPRNGTALAGLLALRNSSSPALEVELRTLIGRNPEASSLRFSLGNLYASERRWVEAQQAYFEAYRLESENADYAYNLAVSLDHLKQEKLALDYYHKALVRLAKSGGQFDVSAVNRRIKDLSADAKRN